MTSSTKSPWRICVIGSGPAGFYSAQQLLKKSTHLTRPLQVDMLEALPVPYGLVRYGVAPDHPEVKAVQNQFEEIAADPRFCFIGNVRVGTPKLSLQDLRSRYNALVLAFGASQDRMLNIPGETSLKNILGAKDFVGWYNGDPSKRQLAPDLRHDTATIIGQGNVALDVARILLTPVDILRKTDMTEYALQALAESQVRRVHIVGRRGPVQVSFTSKELREMLKIPQCRVVMDRQMLSDQLQAHHSFLESNRPKRRLMDLLAKYKEPSNDALDIRKECHLDFFRSPARFIPDSGDPSRVGGIQFDQTRLKGSLESPSTEKTGEQTVLETGLAIRSIGYQVKPVPGLPFDDINGYVPNDLGRVLSRVPTTAEPTHDVPVIPGLYVAGWLKRGPSGIIATTMRDAFQTASTILSDLQHPHQSSIPDTVEIVQSRDEVLEWLKGTSKEGSPPVLFEDWKRVEREEERIGRGLGKPREKFTSIDEIMKVVKGKDATTSSNKSD